MLPRFLRRLGFSWSWRRLLGITSLKRKISREIGIPLSAAGRQQKIGRLIGGKSGCGCVVILVFLLLAAVSLVCGGMVYILWRRESLLMFTWFDALGLKVLVRALRGIAAPYSHIFPPWVYFSLPQALWLFSGILFLDCIWRDVQGWRQILWMAAFVAVAFGLELGQFSQVVPGHFDILDTILLVASFLAAGALVRYRRYLERGRPPWQPKKR